MTALQNASKVAAKGAFYTGASQIARMALSTVSVIIVARLLTPNDYGVAAMVSPVTTFLLIFQNLGFSQAAIQAKILTQNESSAMFWVNVLASGAIAAIMLMIAPLVGLFYNDPRAAYYTAAMSVTVLITGAGLQHIALLNRELRFKALSAIDVAVAAATLLGTAIAAIVLHSYWALWWGAAAGAVVQSVLMWRTSRFRPNLRPTISGIASHMRFGGSITGSNLATYVSRNLDNILIAKVWGTEAVGLYDRGFKLMMYPMQNINFPLARIMLPILSRLTGEPERFRRAYLHSVRAIALASVPGVAVIGGTSTKLIPFLLGPNWTGVVPIFHWLSLAALVLPLSHPPGWLFMAFGRGKAILRWGLFSALLVVTGFAVSVWWGPTAVALSYFITQAIRTPPMIWYSSKGTPIRQIDLYAIALPSYLAAGIIWLVLATLSSEWSIWPLLLVGLPTSYLLAIALHAASSDGRQFLKLGWNLAGERLPVLKRIR